MKISLIIPTYNPQNYLFECLASICAQTMDSSMYEVLIILNGNKQPYYDQICSYIFDKKNWKLFFTNIAGVSNARNLGLENALGEYICFIDDDDIISSTYLEMLYSSISPSTLAISNSYAFGNNINCCEGDYLTNAFVRQPSFCEDLYHSRSFFSTVWGKLISRELINKTRFSLSYKIGEDSLFMIQISKNVKGIVKVGNEAIYYRRLRDGSASRMTRKWMSELNRKMRFTGEYLKLCFKQNYNLIFLLSRICALWIKS